MLSEEKALSQPRFRLRGRARVQFEGNKILALQTRAQGQSLLNCVSAEAGSTDAPGVESDLLNDEPSFPIISPDGFA